MHEERTSVTESHERMIAFTASSATEPASQPAAAQPVRMRRSPLLVASALVLAAHGVMNVTACSSSSQNASPNSGTAPGATPNSPATPGEATPPRAAEPQAAEEPKELLGVGAAAPDVSGKDATGATVRLSERRGRPAIVYFYPKNDTPGCTKEACAFRDTFDKFKQHGVTIFGVSRDDESSHAAFREKYSLPFPLVADPSGSVQSSYGVPTRFPGMASRVTFLVAADGRIAKVWPDVDPAVHADEVLAAIAKL
jgi:thioredoxin-dependent peroxiredoxin